MKVERASYDPDAKRLLLEIRDADTRIQMDIVGTRASWFRRVFKAGLNVDIDADDQMLAFYKYTEAQPTENGLAPGVKPMYDLDEMDSDDRLRANLRRA